MKPKTIYLLLCFLGLIVPYAEFVPWLTVHGLDMTLFFRELMSTRIGAFFGMDVFVSALVLIVFMRTESARRAVRYRWLPLLALLSAGVSLALPLFLYLREENTETH